MMSCKNEESSTAASPSPSPSASPSPQPLTLTDQLKQLAAATQGWSDYCGDSVSKENCDDGDSVLFGGLACAAGDARACKGVRQSQDETGRWWRSESQKK